MEQERKEKAKQAKADLIAQQKKEGTYLTKKQKQERERAQRIFQNAGILISLFTKLNLTHYRFCFASRTSRSAV